MSARPSHDSRRLATGALLLTVVLLAMIVTLTTDRDQSTTGDAAASARPCASTVAVVAPADDLAVIVEQHGPGTCFTLAAGVYRFHDVVPKDGMSFTGAATDAVIVDGQGYENAFHGTTDGVSISRMTFRGFDDSGGTKRQEQAPIRGTARLWASDAGAMATNWTISEIVSSGNFANGIFVGDFWTVRDSVFHSNGVTGIGGDSIVGTIIERNVIYGNGAEQASGAYVNGGGIKLGQAGTVANPVIVRNNELYQNTDIAIWCDIGCRGFHVLDNDIHDHPSRGVMYELSSNLVVRGNTILRSNTWTNFAGDFNAGAITMGESRNGLIENNVIDGARSGVTIRQTKRPASGESFLTNYPTVNYLTADVTVRNNTIRNTAMMGVSTGVTGVGLIPAVDSIVFSANTYDDPAAMTFWWNDGQQMSFDQWQAAGRDLPPGVVPPPQVQPNESAGEGSPTTGASTPDPAVPQGASDASPTSAPSAARPTASPSASPSTSPLAPTSPTSAAPGATSTAGITPSTERTISLASPQGWPPVAWTPGASAAAAAQAATAGAAATGTGSAIPTTAADYASSASTERTGNETAGGGAGLTATWQEQESTDSDPAVDQVDQQVEEPAPAVLALAAQGDAGGPETTTRGAGILAALATVAAGLCLKAMRRPMAFVD